MKKIFALILLFSFGINACFAQFSTKIKEILDRKNFSEFENFYKNELLNESSPRIYTFMLRDITHHTQEGIFVFEKYETDPKNPSIASVTTYRVRLLTYQQNIIFYELSKKLNKRIGGNWEPYYDIIAHYKNYTAYREFQHDFKNIFQTNLNEKELFELRYIYGEKCSIVGIDPIEKTKMKAWVKKGNKTKIRNWLTATNTEKQLYAFEGLLQLKKAGISLTKQEEKMMNFVANKNGMVQTCAGCSYTTEGIQEVIHRIQSE
ncbi:hypothetical protein U8527_21315 [Kordia algicida OT-1]|uniref:hypothetical protein n=1 Tax=Kordia algicida TaxID=221066 RepID=UPI003D9BEEA9